MIFFNSLIIDFRKKKSYILKLKYFILKKYKFYKILLLLYLVIYFFRL